MLSSYSTVHASIIRVMLYELQDMADWLVCDHVVIAVPCKYRKALLDPSPMVDVHVATDHSANTCDYRLKMPLFSICQSNYP